MSVQNRKNEYDRLVRLDKRNLIPQSLLDEFESKQEDKTVKKQKKGNKENGR